MLEGFLVLGVHGEVIVLVKNLHGLVSQQSWETEAIGEYGLWAA